jgi:hypothetical protein
MFRAILCSSSGGPNRISTASGIVTLCERPCSAPVESGLYGVNNLKLYISSAIRKLSTGRDISLFHRAFQFTMSNGPTYALVCN